MNLFEQLGLDEPTLRVITGMSFEAPSEIQQKTIPTLLEDDTDMVASVQTGTGKTTTLGFPLLQLVDADSKLTQGLILPPTRELCLQIASELRNYVKYLPKADVVVVYDGTSIEEQARGLRKGAQVIVTIPGCMQGMIRRNFMDTNHISYCILDEADEMLNMSFYEDTTAILSYAPREKSTWLFSATMPNEVVWIVHQSIRRPIEITVDTRNQASNTVQHEYYVVNGRHRYQTLERLVDTSPDISSVVFCRTKKGTQAVAKELIEDGCNVAALRGDLSQNQRDLVMKFFRTRQIQILVATDVTARGVGVDDITHVIYYQLPDEIETYNRRSRRTGRAGKSGTSMVPVPRNELRKVKEIEKIIKQSFEQKALPTGIKICEIQLHHLANSLKNIEVNPTIKDYLPTIYKELQHIDCEEPIKRIFAAELIRLFNYYKNAEVLLEEDTEESRRRGDSSEMCYFINIGERGGYDWKTLKDFLKVTLNLGRDDVSKVDVKNSFSFFNTEADQVDLVASTLADFRMDGGFIDVEVSDKGVGRSRGDKKGGESGRKGKDKRKGEKKGEKKSCKQKTVGAFEQAFKRKKKRR